MEIKSPRTHEEFMKYYDLRWRVLRSPEPRGSERDELDHLPQTFHLASFTDYGQVISVGRLHHNTSEETQIRYMATEEEFRGKGMGRLILEILEKTAIERGAQEIFANVRIEALNLYLKAGFEKEGQVFLYRDIPHQKVSKQLVK